MFTTSFRLVLSVYLMDCMWHKNAKFLKRKRNDRTIGRIIPLGGKWNYSFVNSNQPSKWDKMTWYLKQNSFKGIRYPIWKPFLCKLICLNSGLLYSYPCTTILEVLLAVILKLSYKHYSIDSGKLKEQNYFITIWRFKYLWISIRMCT